MLITNQLVIINFSYGHINDAERLFTASLTETEYLAIAISKWNCNIYVNNGR